MGVEGDPGEGRIPLFGYAPLGEEHRLAVAGRGANKGKLAIRARTRELDELGSSYEPLAQKWRIELCPDKNGTIREYTRVGEAGHKSGEYFLVTEPTGWIAFIILSPRAYPHELIQSPSNS